MRQALFILAFCGLLPAIVISPFAGVVVYEWLEYLNPNVAYYAYNVPDQLSFIVGALTFTAWFVKDKKYFGRPTALIVILVLLFIWFNVTTLTALVPVAAEWQWQRTVKVVGFCLLTAQMMSTRGRVEAFVWVLVLAVAFSAVPGAIKTALSGGGGETVVGLGGSFIGDRVMFAVFLSMTIPLALFLARYSALLPRSWWLTWGMRGVALCCVIASIGTFARTALFASGVAAIMLVVKSRRRMAALGIAGIVLCAALAVAPASWYQRMDTTVNYQNDSSATDRLAAWAWSYEMALNHPITGGGFKVSQLFRSPNGGWMEAHNIFFEMMAEHGFIGLALFCGLLATVYWNCRVVHRRSREFAELAWAGDLANQVQIGVIVFIAGGFFASIATDPFIYDWAAIAIGLRGIVDRELLARRKALSVAVPVSELVDTENTGMLPA